MTPLLSAFGLLALLPADTAPKATSVPFERLPTGHITIQVRVNGKGPYRVVFDTGAPINLLSTRVGKDAGLTSGDAASSLLGSLLDAKPGVMAQTLEAGSARTADVPVVVLDHPAIELMSQVFGRVDGIVGFPFYARFKIAIDYQARRLTLTPNGYKPPDAIKMLMESVSAVTSGKPARRFASPKTLWGLRLRDDAAGGAGVIVADVLESGSASAGGLRAGDRILTIDGRWTDTVADGYTAAARAVPGKPVAVTLKRGGETLTLSVIPRLGS